MIKPNDDQIFDALQQAIAVHHRQNDGLSRAELSTLRAAEALRLLGFGWMEPCGRGTARYQVVRAIFG